MSFISLLPPPGQSDRRRLFDIVDEDDSSERWFILWNDSCCLLFANNSSFLLLTSCFGWLATGLSSGRDEGAIRPGVWKWAGGIIWFRKYKKMNWESRQFPSLLKVCKSHFFFSHSFVSCIGVGSYAELSWTMMVAVVPALVFSNQTPMVQEKRANSEGEFSSSIQTHAGFKNFCPLNTTNRSPTTFSLFRSNFWRGTHCI